jgi:hypothetical protein
MAVVPLTATARRDVWALVLVAVVVRAGLIVLGVLHGSTFRSNDSALYLALAEALARDGVFALDGVAHSFRTPGYPLLLAPGVWLGHVTPWIIGLQLAMAAATVVATRALGLWLTRERAVANIGALLLACEPYSAVYSGLVLTEVSFALMLTLHLLGLVWFLEAPPASRVGRGLVLAGLACAASAWLRPITYTLPLLVLLVLAVARVRPRHLALYAASALLPLLAWQLRNGAQTGDYGFYGGSSHTAYYYVAIPIRARLEGRSADVLRDEEGVWRAVGALSSAEREAHEGQAQALVLAHPLVFAGLVGERFWRTLTVNDNARVAQLVGPRLARADKGLRMAWWIVLATATLGLLGTRARWTLARGLVLMCVAFVLFVPALVTDDPRYRMPVVPVICVWAAVGLGLVWRSARRVIVRPSVVS